MLRMATTLVPFVLIGDLDRAVAFGQRALDLATTPEDFTLQVVTRFHLGGAYAMLGDYRRAIDVLTWNIAFIEGELLQKRFGLPALPSVMSRAILAYSLAERGAFAEGLTHGEEASRIAEGVNHALSRLWPLRWVGDLYLLKGDLYRAMPELERGLALSQVAYLPIWIAHFAWRLGYAYALSGRIVEAEPLLEQAVQQYTFASMRVEQSRSVVHLGEAYVLAHRMEDAQNWAECALDLTQTHKQRGIQAWALRLLGDIARHRHPPETGQAETRYQQALTLASELGMRPLQAHCHRGLGTLYSQTGQSEQARVELSTAIEMYRDMEMTFWLPETESALAAVEGSS